MIDCPICGNDVWQDIVAYTIPDKYESWVGIKEVQRDWRKCSLCGLYCQTRNYPLKDLEKIYSSGYRNSGFRGETIEEAFNRIMAIPNNENNRRVEWLTGHIGAPKNLLDIGAGIGVFPALMREKGANPSCVEANSESLRFINSMGIPCTIDIPEKSFEMVSMVHLLEHLEQPQQILNNIKKNISSEGWLFVEVPNAKEFGLLDKDHDEFNSCHILFFDKTTLPLMLEKAGYRVVRLDELEYPERGLSRVVALCKQ